MNMTNKEIRARARYLLDGNVFGKDWLKSAFISFLAILIILIPANLIFNLLALALDPFVSWLMGDFKFMGVLGAGGVLTILEYSIESLLLNIFIGPVAMGLASVHMDLVRGDGSINIREFFESFRNFVDNFLLGFMYTLHTMLWSLLFVIPGIYVSYSYAMVFHVKKDHPDYRWQQCLDESERLMQGNRWRLFKLQCSFIGWMIIGMIAFLFVGAFWVIPYQQLSIALFYEQIKDEKESNIVSFESNPNKSTDPVVVDLTQRRR